MLATEETPNSVASLVGLPKDRLVEVLGHRNCTKEKKKGIRNVLERSGLYDEMDVDVKAILG